MPNIFIDIETIPTNDPVIIDQIRESIAPPGNITKDESRLKWLEENLESELEKAVRKTALDGLYGEILSIAWSIDNKDINVLYRKSYNDSEKELLTTFFEKINAEQYDRFENYFPITRWIGHFISGFDLRFIWQRCVINQVTPNVSIPYRAKPWEGIVFDTKIEWSGSSQYSGASSLSKLSYVMLGEGKGDIDGSNVYDYFMKGEIEKIAEYNKTDVEMVRNLYHLMTFGNEKI